MTADSNDSPTATSTSSALVYAMDGSVPQTMSSREIADLCEARHNDVAATIARLFEQGVLRGSRNTLRPFIPKGGGRPTQVYDLTKRDTLVVVSGYSAELRARIIDRWQELEAAATPKSAHQIDGARECRLSFGFNLRLAKMIGLQGNQALLSANRATAALTGRDMLHLIGADGLTAPQNEALLTPTDIGQRSGLGSGRVVNQRLCQLGLQVAHRDAKNALVYEPTEAGRRAGAIMQDTGKRHSNGAPVRQLKWASRILNVIDRPGSSEVAA